MRCLSLLLVALALVGCTDQRGPFNAKGMSYEQARDECETETGKATATDLNPSIHMERHRECLARKGF